MLKHIYTVKTNNKKTTFEMTEEKIEFITDALVKLGIPCTIYNEDGSVYYESFQLINQ